MALNFPADPTIGDQYSDGTTTWEFDGTVWNVITVAPVVGSIPNSFNTVSVDGQNDVVAETTNDTLTLVAGDNVTITTDDSADSVTISTSGGGGGGGDTNQNAFSIISVAGQTAVEADEVSDTLVVAAGDGISITTNPDADTITIENTLAASDIADFTDLGDSINASLTIDKIYEPAIAMIRMNNVGTTAYTTTSHYADQGQNPTLYALSGTTIAFDLDSIPGHPFLIQDATATDYNTGLVHVAINGAVSTGASAQGKDSGTLYWRIPESISGNYRYQCSLHAGMVGAITVKRLSVI
jgi:plastocyanin